MWTILWLGLCAAVLGNAQQAPEPFLNYQPPQQQSQQPQPQPPPEAFTSSPNTQFYPLQNPPMIQRRSLMDLTKKIFGGTYVTLHVGDMPPNHPLVKYPPPYQQSPTHAAATVQDQRVQAFTSQPHYSYVNNMHYAKAPGSNHYFKPNPHKRRPPYSPHHHPRNPNHNYNYNYPVPISYDSTEHNPTQASEVRPFEPSQPDTSPSPSYNKQNHQQFPAPTYDHNQHYLHTPDPLTPPDANSFNQNTTDLDFPQGLEPPAPSNNRRRHALSPPTTTTTPHPIIPLNITFPTKPPTHYRKAAGGRRKRPKFYTPPPFPSIRQSYSTVNSYGASSEERRRSGEKQMDADGKTMYIFSSSSESGEEGGGKGSERAASVSGEGKITPGGGRWLGKESNDRTIGASTVGKLQYRGPAYKKSPTALPPKEAKSYNGWKPILRSGERQSTSTEPR